MELGITQPTNTHNTRSLIRSLKYVLDILQTEEAHTHTHTHTQRKVLFGTIQLQPFLLYNAVTNFKENFVNVAPDLFDKVFRYLISQKGRKEFDFDCD